MLHLLIEVHDYRQRLRIDQALAALVASIETSLEARSGRRLKSDAGYLFFVMDEAAGANARLALDALIVASGILAAAEDGGGYYCLLESFHEEASAESVYRSMKDACASLCDARAVLLGPEAARLLADLVNLEPGGGLFRFLGLREDIGARPKSAALFCRRPEVESALGAEVEKAAGGRNDAQAILVCGPPAAGGLYLVQSSAEGLCGPGGYLRVRACPGDPSPLAPLLTLFSPTAVRAAEGGFSTVERSVWKEKVRLLDYLRQGPRGLCLPDAEDADVLAVARCLLSGFLRHCETMLTVPLLVVEDVHILPSKSLIMISRLMREATHPRGFIFILLSSKPYLPVELKAVAFSLFKIPSVSIDEAEELTASLAGDFSSARRRFDRGGIMDLFYFLQIEESSIAEVEPRTEILLRKDEQTQTVLYTLCILGGLHELLAGFWEERGLARTRIRHILEDLEAGGFVCGSSHPFPTDPALKSLTADALAERREAIEAELGEYLLRRWREGALHREEILLEYFRERGDTASLAAVFFSHVNSCLVRGRFNAAEELLYGPLFKDCPPDGPRQAQWLETLVACLRLFLAMARFDSEEAGRCFALLDSLPLDENPSRFSALIHKARWLIRLGDFKTALGLVKQAVVVSQDNEDTIGVAQADLELAMVMMAEEHIHDAKDYSAIANEAAARSGDRLEQLRSAVCYEVAHYLLGNFSRVLEGIEKASDVAAALMNRRWQILCDFLRARVLFELGMYDQAREAFERILPLCRAADYGGPVAAVTTWLARTFVHQGHIASGLRVLEGLEPSAAGEFFTAEAYGIRQDFEQARLHLRRSAELDRQPEPFCGMPPSWRDCYFLENSGIGRRGESILARQRNVFDAYCQGLRSRNAEAIAAMRRMTRDEKSSIHDPNNRIYLYWYAEILPMSGSRDDGETEDRLTVLGKAVKHLQERTSRIDEPAHKAVFLYQQCWNKRLIAEARSHNLI